MVDTKDLKSFGFTAVRVQVPLRVHKFEQTYFAEVAQLVEHNLAKVRVAGSSPVFRSTKTVSTNAQVAEW